MAGSDSASQVVAGPPAGGAGPVAGDAAAAGGSAAFQQAAGPRQQQDSWPLLDRGTAPGPGSDRGTAPVQSTGRLPGPGSGPGVAPSSGSTPARGGAPSPGSASAQDLAHGQDGMATPGARPARASGLLPGAWPSRDRPAPAAGPGPASGPAIETGSGRGSSPGRGSMAAPADPGAGGTTARAGAADWPSQPRAASPSGSELPPMGGLPRSPALPPASAPQRATQVPPGQVASTGSPADDRAHVRSRSPWPDAEPPAPGSVSAIWGPVRDPGTGTASPAGRHDVRPASGPGATPARADDDQRSDDQEPRSGPIYVWNPGATTEAFPAIPTDNE